jgi:threonyl-tRNA synthetase
MIHRALFGSIERFFGVLTEHYAGIFPPWLAPVQVVGVPVADEFNEYLYDVIAKLKAHGVRAHVDVSDDRFPKKIRNHTKDKVPFMLIAGGEDRDANILAAAVRQGASAPDHLVGLLRIDAKPDGNRHGLVKLWRRKLLHHLYRFFQ